MLIRRPGQAWHVLPPALHDERALQTLLVQSPGLLPSSGPGELAVAANFRAGPNASVDLLGVGADGRIVLVECGRQDGPARRPMGGSALGVAAALWRASFDEFDRAFAVRAGAGLAERVAAAAKASGVSWDETAFQKAVSDNLNAGQFELILAVDNVSDEVRRVVAYLNSGVRAGLSVVALGLRYLAEEGIEILLPTIYQGDSPGDGSLLAAPADSPPPMAASPAPAPAAPAVVAASTPAPTMAAPPPASPSPNPAPAAMLTAPASAPAPVGGQGEPALFAALEASCLPPAVDAVRRLYHIARDKGRELQWGQGEHPAVTAVFDIGGRPVGVWSCYTDLKPSFVVNFEWLAPHVAPERLERLADRLGQLPSVPERLTGLAEAGYRRRLALAVNAVLAQPGAADVIASAINELLDPASSSVPAAASSAPPPPPGARPSN